MYLWGTTLVTSIVPFFSPKRADMFSHSASALGSNALAAKRPVTFGTGRLRLTVNCVRLHRFLSEPPACVHIIRPNVGPERLPVFIQRRTFAQQRVLIKVSGWA